MIWIIAILAPYAAATALFFTAGTPIWPGLLGACLVAAVKDWRPALALGLAVVLMQVVKQTYPSAHLWVYYAAIYATLGVFSAFLWDKVVGTAGAIISLFYLSNYIAAPMAVIDIGTEGAFMAGLILAVLHGPSGGILGIARKPAGRSYPDFIRSGYRACAGRSGRVAAHHPAMAPDRE